MQYRDQTYGMHVAPRGKMPHIGWLDGRFTTTQRDKRIDLRHRDNGQNYVFGQSLVSKNIKLNVSHTKNLRLLSLMMPVQLDFELRSSLAPRRQ